MREISPFNGPKTHIIVTFASHNRLENAALKCLQERRTIMDSFFKSDPLARSPLQRSESPNTQRKFLAAILLASSHFLLSFAPSAIAQGRFDKVEITTQKIVPGIYMLQGAGGNIGVSTGKNGTFIIDDQFAPLSAKILAAIETITDKPPSFVLNTHWHGDHSGGNENFSQAGATIVAHDNVRKRLISGRDGDEDYESAVPTALPVITFSEQITFCLLYTSPSPRDQRGSRMPSSA